MNNYIIRDLTYETIDDLINLCIPEDRREDPLFKQGRELKRKTVEKVIVKYGAFAKIAYKEETPVGLLQFLPKSEENNVEILCIFVPDKENERRGIGRALLSETIKYFSTSKKYFNNDIPSALIISTFDVPGYYPQSKFFENLGFKKVEGYENLLYYPIKKGYVYSPKIQKYYPQEEDKQKAIIFIDPFCPFSIYFAEKIKESIKEVSPEIPIRIINQYEEAEEVKKRGKISFCIVNCIPIQSFFLDKENFKREIKEALKT